MPEISYSQLRELAEANFVEDQWNFKQIAEYYKLDPKTVGEWAKKGKWKDKRRTFLNAPTRIKLMLMEEAEKIIEGADPKINADNLLKLQKVIEGFDRATNPRIVQTILKKLDNFLSKNYPDLAIQSLKPHREFLAEQCSHYE